MRIAVTGKDGQVVRSLIERAPRNTELIAVGRPELDLAEPHSIYPALAAIKPDLIISAAAYTAVDQAEDEQELAFSINAQGAGLVAEAAAKIGVPIIHLSTDYVFDGTKPDAYTEQDVPNPQTVYGASKLMGEVLVAAANPKHLILRTAWVYSPYGKNFLKTMLKLAQDRNELAVVSDQWGSPTSALDIADMIFHAASYLDGSGSFSDWGLYNVAGTGSINWSGFATYILSSSQKMRANSVTVKEIKTDDYPFKALRPKNSILNNTKFIETFHTKMPRWQHSVDNVIALL